MTVQMPESVWFDGRLFHMDAWRSLSSEPLEMLFSKRPRPEIGLTGTACSRGYVGIWSIRDEPEGRYGRALFLLELQTRRANGEAYAERPFSFADLFGNRSPPILADWFSGKICLVRPYDAAREQDDTHPADAPRHYLTLHEGLVVAEERLTSQESFIRRWRESKAR